MKRVHALVAGKVQGVFFRVTAQKKAQELGLSGWVRNLPDGRVEVVAEGDKESLEMFVDHLRIGPPAAEVENVGTEWGEPRGERGFAVRS